MATRSKLSLSKDDFEDKKFKAAPGGRYHAKITKKDTLVKAGTDGDVLQVHATITKGPHKGTTFFDNIGASVGWKIAQLLKACGLNYASAVKKVKTLQDLLKLIVDEDLQVVLRKTKWNGQDQNKVVQWLPANAEADEDEESDDDEDEEESDDEETEEEGEDEDEEDDEDDEDEAESSDDEDDEDEEDDESDDDAEEDEDEEDDEDEDNEEDDDDDEPVKKKKPTPKKSAPAKKVVARRKK